MRRPFDSEAIERKWLRRWEEGHYYDAQRGRPGDQKFFLHFAYPGISGYLHVGHLRGFSYSDVFVRYKRMTGHRVLFPAGFHASGIPSVGLARRVERGDADTLEYLRSNGCPPEQIPKLKDSHEVVRYFSHVYTEEYWRRFGYSIDWRTLCSTIDPGYHRFIQWQFRRLHQKNLLVVKPHHAPYCPLDGAVAVDASETDISKGGQAEILEFTLLKFRLDDGAVLPCATLRPETVYGVTNLWLNPSAGYQRVAVGGEQWILSEPSAHKLRAQRSHVGEASGWKLVEAADLLRQTAANPMTGQKVPLLPAAFVDPKRATGVVMSVPAHAPYDWQALHEVRPDLKPVVIVKNPKAKGVPAEEACRKHGVRNQLDAQALDLATEEVYSDEFHAGLMLDNTGLLKGLKVSAAKEALKEHLRASGEFAAFLDFSEDVVCRCGRDVIIRQVPDQWFIRYSDVELTERSKQHAATMNVFPDDYKRDLPSVLDWFGDRACIRKGSWLGTEFPLKPGWIIEPISDSTFYPAYYVVAPFVNAKKMKPEDLSDEFFDYVFLGRGKASSPVWEEARKDFEFWYPVDINLGGKEHKTVHFPPYVMNHVALVEPRLWPRGIFVNWWVTQKAGQKISKSKGGAEPIPGAAKKYSVDGMRLYYCNVASPHQDIEWDPDLVMNARQHVERIFQLVHDAADEPAGASPSGVDAWLRHAWNERLGAARDAFEAFDPRTASQQLYYEFYNDLQWFRRRGGSRSHDAVAVLHDWVLAMAPITPFLAEELHERLGSPGLASTAAFPQRQKETVDAAVLGREAFLRGVLEDVHQIARVTGITPQRVVLHTSPEWKRIVNRRAREAVQRGQRAPGDLIKPLLADAQLKPHAKDIPAYAQKALKEAVERGATDADAPFEEFEFLSTVRAFLEREVGASFEFYRADDPAAPDPGKKRAAAAPRKPAIFVE